MTEGIGEIAGVAGMTGAVAGIESNAVVGTTAVIGVAVAGDSVAGAASVTTGGRAMIRSGRRRVSGWRFIRPRRPWN